VHAHYEDVIPDQELHDGMDYTPEPSGDGAYVALLEIAADQLGDEGSAGYEVFYEVAAGDGGHSYEFS
jgi:hypothetical protein